jgi:CheY-like chemotaxis protein
LGSTLSIALEGNREPVSIVVSYEPEPGQRPAPPGPTLTQLAQRLGWTVTDGDLPGSRRQLVCYTGERCASVLIIDDNQGLVNLLQRYLTDQACRVLTAVNAQEGLRLAQEATPDAILLDVMMPGMQGWEVLQRLHNDPLTVSIPVIVCSVINEPELAQALGAALFLPKPIRQVDVLAALHQLAIV